MMKRTYILYYNVVSVLALLTCACTRTIDADVAASDEMSFSPALASSSTKAIFNGNEFPTDAGAFSVSAVALTGESGTGQSLYFFSKAVDYDGSKWGFKADASGIRPRYYWPLAGGMNFYAFYPESEILINQKIVVPGTDPATGLQETVPVQSEGGLAYKNYTIKHTTGGDAYEPIEADADKNDANLGNAYVDFMSAVQLYDDVNNRTGSSVPLLFTHNLAQIRFAAIAARDLSKVGEVSRDAGADASGDAFAVMNHVDFIVDKIELMNIYSKGTYYSIAPHWRDLKEKYNYFPLTSNSTKLEYDEGVIGSRTPKEVEISGAEMLVIPQSLTDAGMKVWFTVKQVTVRNEGQPDEYVVNDYSETYVKTIDLSSVIHEFKISTCVTFLFRIDLNEIEVSVSYSDWKSEGELTPVI